jgi:multicomponent Na+:H+ antiporter subunit E
MAGPLWRALQTAALLTVLWWILADNAGWNFGMAAIIMATLVALVFPPVSRRWSLRGLGRLIGYFCKESLLAGVQVARLAFKLRPALQPALRDHPLHLPAGPARTLFVMLISLLPGTLSADLDGEVVRVHLLSAELDSDLAPLEEWVADLFVIPLAEADRT